MDIKATANKGFASGGLKYKTQRQFFNWTLVIIQAFVLLFPARTQSPETLCDMLNQKPSKIESTEKMKKENLYYLSGILVLALGSISFYVILIYWLFAILVLSGITLIAISDKKIWLKIATIFIVPIISVFLFFLSLIVFSNEAI